MKKIAWVFLFILAGCGSPSTNTNRLGIAGDSLGMPTAGHPIPMPDKSQVPVVKLGECGDCKWWYIDQDGDTYGSPVTKTTFPQSPQFKKKQPSGFVLNNTDCNDASAKINPSAHDSCGYDFNCNGIVSENIPLTDFYKDKDGDGYGDPAAKLLSCNNVETGYVKNNQDCNDANKDIHPAGVEVLNGIDDNCNGNIDEGLVVAGIKVITSTVLIPEYMGAGGTNEMFANNDPNDPNWLNKIKPGNFSAWVHAEGHNSEWFRWHEPYGSKGNGFNPGKTPPCEIMNGDLCKSYPRDFNISWVDLITNTGGKPVYTCNIARGTLSELYYVIDKYPSLNVIMYGQELPSGDPAYRVLDAKTYPPKFYAWVDSVKKKYPGRSFYHLADMPDIYGSKEPIWISEFKKYKKMPLDVGIRLYLHGFHRYTLTGKVLNDTAAYNNDIKAFLPNYLNKIDTTYGSNITVFVSQLSVGVPGYATQPPQNGNTVICQSRLIDVMHYMRSQKVLIEYNMKGSLHTTGTNIIGLKNLLTSLDFKWLSVLNKLYLTQNFSTTVTHDFGSNVDVLIGSLNGTYSVVIQNRSDKEIILPEYWDLDGKIVKPVYSGGDGYSCSSLTSTTGSAFNPLTGNKVLVNGIAFFQLK